VSGVDAPSGESAKFKPARLSRASIEAPMEARWRVMGAQDAARFHRQALAEHARFSRTGPRSRRRFVTLSIGTMIASATLSFVLFFTTWFVPVFAVAGFVLGAVVAVVRPFDYLCGLLYGLAGLGASLSAHIHPLLALLTGAVFFCIGLVAGRFEEFKVIDGE